MPLLNIYSLRILSIIIFLKCKIYNLKNNIDRVLIENCIAKIGDDQIVVI